MNKAVVLGVGYVGLPLAVSLNAARYEVIAFDINKRRIQQLQNCIDANLDLEIEQLQLFLGSGGIFTSENTDLVRQEPDPTVWFLVIPTPLDSDGTPDITQLMVASEFLGGYLKKGDLVVVESSVAPFTTREIGSVLSKFSGLSPGVDFMLAYCPERINPGDRQHDFSRNNRSVAGINRESTILAAQIYRDITTGEITEFSSIEAVELSKLLENAQRLLNISLFNGLYRLCSSAGIDFEQTVNAASTKWNFVKFSPGLVGGHCLGVDTVYLHKFAERLDIDFGLLREAYEENLNMLEYIVTKLKNMTTEMRRSEDDKSTVLIAGASYKDDVPDLRNSQAIELTKLLIRENFQVVIFDPIIDNAALADAVPDSVHVMTEPNEDMEVDQILVFRSHSRVKEVFLSMIESIADRNGIANISYFGDLGPLHGRYRRI